MRRLLPVGLTVGLVLAVAVSTSSIALAGHKYQGNLRSLGAGVKASIATPSSTPWVDADSAIVNFVSNVDTADGGTDWVQVGWAQGNEPDGGWNNNPTSYREARIDAFYDYDAYSQQALNFARLYEVVNVGWDSVTSSYGWRTIIAGQSRGDYYGFSEKSPVEGMFEMIDSSNQYDSDDSAAFTSVQYKGNYSYMNFDQDNRVRENPPFDSWTWTDTYTYTTHAGAL